MEVKLRTLKKIVRYAQSLPISEENREDFIQFCALQIFSGRDTRTRYWCHFVDFVRKTCGRYENIYTGQIVNPIACSLEEIPEPRFPWDMENEIISKIDAARCVREIFKKLSTEDTMILNLIYFKDMTARSVAQILGVSESAVSLRLSKIFYKIKRFSSIAKLEIGV